MKKVTKKSLDKQCEIVWRAIIHSKKYCEVCGASYTLNAHHIITKGNHNLRWDIRNGCLLCVSHHKWGNPSAHGNIIWFAEWLKSHRADDYEYLKDPKWTKTKTWYISDYQEILQRLKEEYAKLETEKI